MTKKARQVILPKTTKIQAKLNPSKNSLFAMEVHDSCLTPNSRKAVEEDENRQAQESDC